jgi:hypothetical protein
MIQITLQYAEFHVCKIQIAQQYAKFDGLRTGHMVICGV